ncbi:hypothetical protein ACFVXQ_00080 [Kitasatospora sp. NPDC058263]
MTIPPAAAQTILSAAWDASDLGPDDVAHSITTALAEAGWQITPAQIEDPDDTPLEPHMTTLAQAVAAHSFAAAQNPHDGICCLDCSTTSGEWVPWPCGPLLDAATVEPIEGGWAISARA